MTPKQFFNKDLQYGDKVEVVLKPYETSKPQKRTGYYGGLRAWRGTIKDLRWDVFVILKGFTKAGGMSNIGIFGILGGDVPISNIQSIRKIS